MAESDIAALERVIFDRGHGSAWGCQFYAELTPAGFVITRFLIPPIQRALCSPAQIKYWHRKNGRNSPQP